MAFTKKPLKWTALGQEPSELKKSEGFKMDESPAPGHFDFMFRSTYEAIEELQQKAGEVKTVNNIQPDSNGNVLITLPDTSKLYQKPTSGIPKADLEATVQASLKKADDAAPLTELAKTNQVLTTHQADLAHVHWIGTATGTNALTANYEAITALKNGLGVAFLNTTSSTLATTLNINGLGAIPILKANGNPVTNLKANGIYTLRYANGNFILQGEGGEYGTATASDVLAGKTFGTENGLVEGIATISSLGGKKFATGTFVWNNQYISINSMSFRPKMIIFEADFSKGGVKRSHRRTMIDSSEPYANTLNKLGSWSGDTSTIYHQTDLSGVISDNGINNISMPSDTIGYQWKWIAFE